MVQFFCPTVYVCIKRNTILSEWIQHVVTSSSTCCHKQFNIQRCVSINDVVEFQQNTNIFTNFRTAILYSGQAVGLSIMQIYTLFFFNFLTKLFKTNNLKTVTYCRTQFNFDLPSTVLKERSDAFARRYKLCNNVSCTVVVIIVV